MRELIPLFAWLYLACGTAYIVRYFADIYNEYDLCQYDGIKELVIISLLTILWLPYAVVTNIIGWTIDATYNMVKWFVLKGQIDKDGFEKEDFE